MTIMPDEMCECTRDHSEEVGEGGGTRALVMSYGFWLLSIERDKTVERIFRFHNKIR